MIKMNLLMKLFYCVFQELVKKFNNSIHPSHQRGMRVNRYNSCLAHQCKFYKPWIAMCPTAMSVTNTSQIHTQPRSFILIKTQRWVPSFHSSFVMIPSPSPSNICDSPFQTIKAIIRSYKTANENGKTMPNIV